MGLLIKIKVQLKGKTFLPTENPLPTPKPNLFPQNPGHSQFYITETIQK